jgi:hypothetical protein
MPPWVVQYRPMFGAPFEAEWLDRGWSTHIFIRTIGGGPDHHLDVVCREPPPPGGLSECQEALAPAVAGDR